MAAFSLPPFDLICVTYLGGSAPVAADFTFFFFFWQLVDIFDWEFKTFTLFFNNYRVEKNSANVKKNVKILNFQPKISTSNQTQEKKINSMVNRR